MSTTPRTDSALLSSDCACNCGHTFKLLSEEKYDQGKCVCTGPDIANGNDGVVVLADFARTLETELAAAQQEAAHYMSVAQKATDELARLRAEVERLKKQIKDDNRSYGCELRDPNGTIWEQAAKDHARAERAEEQLALKNSQCERAERAAAGALVERDALAKDKARLNWLAVSDVWFDVPADKAFTPETFRAAIDAAMKP